MFLVSTQGLITSRLEGVAMSSTFHNNDGRMNSGQLEGGTPSGKEVVGRVPTRTAPRTAGKRRAGAKLSCRCFARLPGEGGEVSVERPSQRYVHKENTRSLPMQYG